MDDLYNNLENYNEESTIAELQSQNKELKSKLEDYATTLDKLQKDFDKLSSEYKKLEANYSSLMKTAKAEIERKTQMIKNLNIEKDKIIIESYQNKNRGGSFHRNTSNERPKFRGNQIEQIANEIEPKQNCKPNEIITKKISPPSSAQSNIQESLTVKDTSNVNIDTHIKWHNTANSDTKLLDPRIPKNNETKENIIKCTRNEKETSKARAPIRNRRKSMPAMCLDLEKFSTDDDDDDLLSGSTRQKTDNIHSDHKFGERKASKISETSSLEDRHSGHHDPAPDVRRSRQSRYDVSRTDDYRKRHKSSHRHNRISPDRNRRDHNYENTYRRDYHDRNKSEHDRRRLESPPRDSFHWRRNRDPPRNNIDRSHERYKQEPERQHRVQEKYPLKHKIQHSYDESDSKRMKTEPHQRQKEDPRLQEPFDNVHFSSCESPDYTCSDVSSHPIREIKLYATTKLDDPRMFNKNYSLNKDIGNLTLSTTQRSTDLIPINKICWGIEPMDMPEALIRRPTMETGQSVNQENVAIDSVHNVSIESGEIPDSEHFTKVTWNKESKIEHKVADSINSRHVLKRNSYKIPKVKKNVDEYQCENISEIRDNKYRKIDATSKTHNANKLIIKPVQENSTYDMQNKVYKKEKSTYYDDKHNRVCNQMKNELPLLGSNDLYELKTNAGSKVLECDLEMSDDNCDNIQLSNNSKYIVNTPFGNCESDMVQNETVKQSIDDTERCLGNLNPKNSDLTKLDHRHKRSIVETYKTIDDKDKCKDIPMDFEDKTKNNTLDDIKVKCKDKTDIKEKSKFKTVEEVQDKCKDTTVEDAREKCRDKIVDAKEKSKNKTIEDVQEKFKDRVIHGKEKSKNKTEEDVQQKSKDKVVDGKEKSKNNTAQDVKVKSKDKIVDSKEKLKNKTGEDVHKNCKDKTVDVKDTCKDKTVEDIKQSRNRKKLKNKEDVDSKIPIPIAEKPFTRKEMEEGIKTKQMKTKTKFIDLFDDSSSLISPEDLGLIAVPPVNADVVNEKCNPLFEDAQDAADMDAIKEAKLSPAAEKSHDNREDKQNNINFAINTEPAKMSNLMFVDKSNSMQNIDKEMIDNIYMNLEPGVPEKENNVVKTVIISTGVQPNISIDNDASQPLRQFKTTIQGVALATSTPNKSLLTDVAPEVDAKLPGSNTSDSQLANVEDPATDNSYNNTTLDSQTNTTDVPDVRIVVKRRRKVVKK